MKTTASKVDKKSGETSGFRQVAVISLVAFIAALAYAVVRYHVIKGVPWDDFPLYILNKAVSLAAVFLIAMSYEFGPLARFLPRVFVPLLPARKYLGLLGFGLAAVHAVMSLLLFSPAYYPKFFSDGGKLNLTGELSMLFGILAFFIFFAVALASIPSIGAALDERKWKAVQRAGYLALALVLLHVFVMGIEGWLKPSGWPGGLLPISLVASVVIAFTLLVRIAVALFPGRRQ